MVDKPTVGSVVFGPAIEAAEKAARAQPVDLGPRFAAGANAAAAELAALRARVAEFQTARPIDEYHEDQGAVLWWRFPIVEPPYCGQPSDDHWTEDYYTHWSPLPDCRLLRPSESAADVRPCTCHPDDNPPVPCPRMYALHECRRAAQRQEGV